MSIKEIECKSCKEVFILRQEESENCSRRKIPEPNYCPICRNEFYKKRKQEEKIKEDAKRAEQKKQEYIAYEKLIDCWPVESFESIKIEDGDQVLYVLGNGFDLIHGVRSSYWDFGRTIGKNSSMAFYLDNYLEVDDLWEDFENALAKINVEGMCSTYVLDTHLDMMDAYNPDANAASFFGAIDMAIEPIRSMNTELKERFGKWIGTLTVNTDDRPFSGIIKEGKVLDFNYTEFVENLYGVDESDICYIHGSRKKRKGQQREELILGHMPGDSDAQYDFKNKYAGINLSGHRAQMLYDAQQVALNYVSEADNGITKHCDRIIKKHEEFFDGLSGINRIITIGHSLNYVDWDYFAEVIRQNNKPSNIRWEFGCFNAADLERISNFIEHFKIDMDAVRIFRSDMIKVCYKEAPVDVFASKHGTKHSVTSKMIGKSDDNAWTVFARNNKVSIVHNTRKEDEYTRIFSSNVNDAIFDKSGRVLFLVMRGVYKGVFLFRYEDSGGWKFVTELEGIPNQGVMTRRLKKIVLKEGQVAFLYNSRIRKYDLSDGTLVYNKPRNRYKSEVITGEDLTEKFLKTNNFV